MIYKPQAKNKIQTPLAICMLAISIITLALSTITMVFPLQFAQFLTRFNFYNNPQIVINISSGTCLFSSATFCLLLKEKIWLKISLIPVVWVTVLFISIFISNTFKDAAIKNFEVNNKNKLDELFQEIKYHNVAYIKNNLQNNDCTIIDQNSKMITSEKIQELTRDLNFREYINDTIPTIVYFYSKQKADGLNLIELNNNKVYIQL